MGVTHLWLAKVTMVYYGDVAYSPTIGIVKASDVQKSLANLGFVRGQHWESQVGKR